MLQFVFSDAPRCQIRPRTVVSNEPSMSDVFIKAKSWTGYQSLIPEVHEYREPGCLVQAPCAVFRQAISPGDLCRLVQPDPSQHMNQGHLSPATTTGSGAGRQAKFRRARPRLYRSRFLELNIEFSSKKEY